MSELTNSRSGFVRSGLLASVSAFALLGAVYASQGALAESGSENRPTVWIELGGQLERADGSQELFSPPFFDKATPAVLAPMVDAQLMPHYSIGGEGKVTFAPNDVGLGLFRVRTLGRSNANRHLHYESKHPVVPIILGGYVVTSAASTKDEFGDAQSSLKESHTIVDFKAGKDVGLGLFGGKSTSVLSAGVRFAQFVSSSDVSLHARPVYHSLPPFHLTAFYLHSNYHQSNKAIAQSRRSTRLVGPEVSWDASTPVAGNEIEYGSHFRLGRERRSSIWTAAGAGTSPNIWELFQGRSFASEIFHKLCKPGR